MNLVGLEDYLLGVVPKEMPPAWGDDAPAALQAQAVAARTYALANLDPGREWDLYDDQRSQVYGGRTAEDPRTSAAVRATADQVATYRGRPIAAFFSASSGGHTEAGVNVFGAAADVPYLAGVPDPFDDSSPYHRWSAPVAVSARRLAGLLGLAGSVASVDVVRRGVSPRVLEARVTMAWPFYGRREVSGATLKADLALPDTWFSVAGRTVDAHGAAVPVPAGAGPRRGVAGRAERLADAGPRRPGGRAGGAARLPGGHRGQRADSGRRVDGVLPAGRGGGGHAGRQATSGCPEWPPCRPIPRSSRRRRPGRRWWWCWGPDYCRWASASRTGEGTATSGQALCRMALQSTHQSRATRVTRSRLRRGPPVAARGRERA